MTHRRGRSAGPRKRPKLQEINVECVRITGRSIHATTDLAESSPRGGRYHEKGEQQPFYAALTREGAFAEVMKHAGGRIASARVTHTRVQALVLDAYSPGGLAAVGLRRRHLIRSDNRQCLVLAKLARSLGCQGLLVPSAVTLGANVIIWREDAERVVEIVTSEISEGPPAATGHTWVSLAPSR